MNEISRCVEWDLKLLYEKMSESVMRERGVYIWISCMCIYVCVYIQSMFTDIYIQ